MSTSSDDLVEAWRSMLRSSSSFRHIDEEKIISQLFLNVQDNQAKNCRYESLLLLADILCHPFGDLIESRVRSLVDRLPVFAEGCCLDCHRDSFIKFLKSILSFFETRENMAIGKIVGKLMSISIRLAKKSSMMVFSCDICSAILSSSFRTHVHQQLAAIKSSMSQYLNNPLYYNSCALNMAYCVAMESSEQWMVSLKKYSADCLIIMKELGMPVVGADLSEYERDIDIDHNLYGKEKASYLFVLFRGYIEVLKQMLLCGSFSGPVSIDCQFFISLFTSLLSLSIRLSKEDPKIYLENEHGTSLHDIAFVATDMKLESLSLLETLLSCQQPMKLLPLASNICRPLASAISSAEFQDVPEFSAACLRCLTLSFTIYSTMYARDADLGVTILLDLLDRQIEFLIRDRQRLANDANGGNNGHKLDVYGLGKYGSCPTSATYETVFECVECCLLHCGALLLPEIVQRIEIALSKALCIVCKGLIAPNYFDRKVKLSCKELIREMPNLQNLLLRISCSSILTLSRNGLVSSNISKLRQFALMAKSQRATSNEATRVLLILDSYLHPTSVPLTSFPISVIVEKHLKDLQSDGKNAMDFDLSKKGGASVALATMTSSSSLTNSSNNVDLSHVWAMQSQSLKRNREDNGSVESTTKAPKMAMDPAIESNSQSISTSSSASSASPSFSFSLNSSAILSSSRAEPAEEEDDDSNDDLPDLI